MTQLINPDSDRPFQQCAGCGGLDNVAPMHQHIDPVGESVNYHFDCHVEDGCELCKEVWETHHRLQGAALLDSILGKGN